MSASSESDELSDAELTEVSGGFPGAAYGVVLPLFPEDPKAPIDWRKLLSKD